MKGAISPIRIMPHAFLPWAPARGRHAPDTANNSVCLAWRRGTTHDDGMVYIEAWHEGVLRDEFIGGCTTPVETIIKECSKSGEGKWTVMTFDVSRNHPPVTWTNSFYPVLKNNKTGGKEEERARASVAQ